MRDVVLYVLIVTGRVEVTGRTLSMGLRPNGKRAFQKPRILSLHA